MKKSLVLMAMAGVALASCVNNEVVDVPQKEQEKVMVAFDTPVTHNNVNSRIVHKGEIGSYNESGNTYSYPKNESFKIFAAWDNLSGFDGWPTTQSSDTELGLAKFNGQSISYVQKVDSWAPMYLNETTNKYQFYIWPQGQYLSYAAMSPAELNKFYKDNEGTLTEETTGMTDYNKDVDVKYGNYTVGTGNEAVTYMGLQIDKFDTPSLPQYHYDLLFSEFSKDKFASDMNHDATAFSGLTVKFQHALSCVRFSLKTDDKDTEAYLHSIKLWGVKIADASFRENITIPTTSWSNFSYNRKNNVNPQWNFDSQTQPTTKDNAFTVFQKKNEQSNKGALFPLEAAMLSTLANGGTYYDLYLVPQSLQDARIEVEYQLDNNSGAIKKEYSLSGHTLDKGGNAITSLEIGTRYTFRLFLSSQAVKEDIIMFAPSTDNWTDLSGIVINLSQTGTTVSTGTGGDGPGNN